MKQNDYVWRIHNILSDKTIVLTVKAMSKGSLNMASVLIAVFIVEMHDLDIDRTDDDK